MSSNPQMVMAQVLYDNVFRAAGAVVTYAGTVVDGFEVQNAYDWRDFSLFRPQANQYVTVTLLAPVIIDTFCVWWAASGSDVVSFEQWNGASWTSMGTISQSNGIMQWRDLALRTFSGDSAEIKSDKFRFKSSGALDLRQVTIGRKLQFPMGQWNGIAPPALTHGVALENVISVNGSVIGRNQRRVTKEGQISMNYLLPEWVRYQWEQFVTHAVKNAFWWRWDPVGHPTEIAFTVAEKIDAPKNSSPPGRMQVSMPILYLS